MILWCGLEENKLVQYMLFEWELEFKIAKKHHSKGDIFEHSSRFQSLKLYSNISPLQWFLAHQTLVWNGLLLRWCGGVGGVGALAAWNFFRKSTSSDARVLKFCTDFLDGSEGRVRKFCAISSTWARIIGKKGFFRMRLSLWTMKNWHSKFCF